MSIDSVQWFYEKSCANKANLQEEEADSIVTAAAKEGRLLFYYKCQMCCSYHLTKSTPSDYFKDFIQFYKGEVCG